MKAIVCQEESLRVVKRPEGKVNCGPMLTGIVRLDGVENAFRALGDPDKHANILIDPRSSATMPVQP